MPALRHDAGRALKCLQMLAWAFQLSLSLMWPWKSPRCKYSVLSVWSPANKREMLTGSVLISSEDCHLVWCEETLRGLMSAALLTERIRLITFVMIITLKCVMSWSWRECRPLAHLRQFRNVLITSDEFKSKFWILHSTALFKSEKPPH